MAYIAFITSSVCHCKNGCLVVHVHVHACICCKSRRLLSVWLWVEVELNLRLLHWHYYYYPPLAEQGRHRRLIWLSLLKGQCLPRFSSYCSLLVPSLLLRLRLLLLRQIRGRHSEDCWLHLGCTHLHHHHSVWRKGEFHCCFSLISTLYFWSTKTKTKIFIKQYLQN